MDQPVDASIRLPAPRPKRLRCLDSHVRLAFVVPATNCKHGNSREWTGQRLTPAENFLPWLTEGLKAAHTAHGLGATPRARCEAGPPREDGDEVEHSQHFRGVLPQPGAEKRQRSRPARTLPLTAQPTEGDPMSDSQFVRLDPSTIKIGVNVRTDLHADAKEFARSIKERGVLEPVTVYTDEDGAYIVLRGQRRTVVAAEVGLPNIPAQVVPRPDEADRITDQMVENLHRAARPDSEIVGGVEQLALVGVSPAQIAKRAALPRDRVNAALVVADKEQTRARVASGDLTLVAAAVFVGLGDDAE